MNNPALLRITSASLALLAVSNTALHGQVAPAAPSENDTDEPLRLSPFIVSETAESDGYMAKDTLAGSRIRTDLRDVASSLTVVTSRMMKDLNATSNASLLQYTPNTEVAGLSGNFSGLGNVFVNGVYETLGATPNRVRGLDSADNTRDLFITDIPWDAFNVDRVEIQRGANSILFGIGSPAGIINAGTNNADFKNHGSVENQLGSFGTVRTSVDWNQVLIDKQLAFRLDALYDNTKYRQDPTFNRDKRIYGSVVFEPSVLNKDWMHTSLRAKFEHGAVHSNLPRTLPPWDYITPFFDADKVNRQLFDPFTAFQRGVEPWSETRMEGDVANPWVTRSIRGIDIASGPMIAFGPNGARTLARQPQQNTYFGIDETGAVDGSIGGMLTDSGNIGITGVNWAAFTAFEVLGETDKWPAADKNFWKDQTLSDPSIFDFYNNLLEGPNKKEWQGWDTLNVSFSQTFLKDRLGYELVYDRQKYHSGQTSLGVDELSIDIRKNLLSYPEGGNIEPTPNPNAGQAMVNGNPTYSTRHTDRKNYRITAFGEIRASDFLAKSWVQRLLGRHIFNGVYSKENYEEHTQDGHRWGLSPEWQTVNGDPIPTAAYNNVQFLGFLSDSLVNKTSAHGLNIPRMNQVSAAGTYDFTYFDSHWNKPTNPSAPGYVDPAAPWLATAKVTDDDPNGTWLTESENPANYVGWTNHSFNVLDADHSQAEREKLIDVANRVRTRTTSKGITWQGFFWDDTLVVTFGARRDSLKQSAGDSSTTLESIANPFPDITQDTVSNTDNSTSWGFVLHTPTKIRENLPWGSDISLSYTDGKNSRVENRYNFSGEQLPNARGRTKDIAVTLSTLNGRLQLKTTFYDTKVFDANIGSVTNATATLGSLVWRVWATEVWGTGGVIADLYGLNGEAPEGSWYWNWAQNDAGGDPAFEDPKSAAFLNSPSTIAQKAAIQSWIDQLQPQSWWDAYGIPLNVAALKNGDYHHAVSAFNPNEGLDSMVGAAGAGRINGVWPNGTVDNESKGVEFELVGQPIKQWNITLNASKQSASQTRLGQDLVNFIEAQHAKFESPAGDLRNWSSSDMAVREYYNSSVWAAYQFQLQTNGKMVPEMAPWRFNGLTTYTFDRGALNGLKLGMAYRWQDHQIIGYHLNAARDNFDIDDPYWGPKEDHIDLLIGYSRRLSQKLGWEVQLNLRNIGERPHLQPFAVQPDGSFAQARIEEGFTWTLTNTITF